MNADLLLVPHPRRMEMTGGFSPVPMRPGVSGPAAELPLPDGLESADVGWCRSMLGGTGQRDPGGESYRLEVVTDGVRLTAPRMSGLRHGLATLAQLLRGQPAKLPCLVIDDAPVFARRGLMLDISRDRIPTMDTLHRLVTTLASLKYNHLQLYCEHALAYVGHEMVWRAADPLTLDELRALDRFAARHGVELAANQNCLGHCERWLRVPGYAHLGELDRPMAQPGAFLRQPSTLCANDPAALDLIRDLLAQQIPCCSAREVNIGCDEPYDLGHGRSADVCAREGRRAVFSRHLSTVAAMVRDLDRAPQFWCDPRPNESADLPCDLTALVWGYEDDVAFAPRAAPHVEAGRAVWVAPGTSNWRGILSRPWNRRGNLARAVAEGRAVGAQGLLLTEWGDRGHRQQWPLLLLALADGAQAAWRGDCVTTAAAAGRHLLGSADLGRWLEEAGEADGPLSRGEEGGETRLRNTSALGHELDRPCERTNGPGSHVAWETVAARLDDLAGRMPDGGESLPRREAAHSLAVARWTATRAVQLRQRTLDQPARHALAEGLAEILGEHRALWLARSRYGGLEDSANWYLRQAPS